MVTQDMKKQIQLLPRLIRLRDAPYYTGMDKNRFNAEVRPEITEIPIGEQGIAFDRLDLDEWIDEYKACNGRPGLLKGETTWDKEERQASTNGTVSGISTSKSEVTDFAKAVAKSTSKRRKNTSPRKRRKSGKRSSTV